VQRRGRDEVLDGAEHAVVHQDRLGKAVATVHDPVTHRREGFTVDRRPVAVEGADRPSAGRPRSP
jgi:hypothetical protein